MTMLAFGRPSFGVGEISQGKGSGVRIPADRSALMANLKHLTAGGKYLTVENADG